MPTWFPFFRGKGSQRKGFRQPGMAAQQASHGCTAESPHGLLAWAKSMRHLSASFYRTPFWFICILQFSYCLPLSCACCHLHLHIVWSSCHLHLHLDINPARQHLHLHLDLHLHIVLPCTLSACLGFHLSDVDSGARSKMRQLHIEEKQ